MFQKEENFELSKYKHLIYFNSSLLSFINPFENLAERTFSYFNIISKSHFIEMMRVHIIYFNFISIIHKGRCLAETLLTRVLSFYFSWTSTKHSFHSWPNILIVHRTSLLGSICSLIPLHPWSTSCFLQKPLEWKILPISQ